MGNKMGPEHSWGLSGRVRTLVPDHILGSFRGHPCQGSVGFVGSAIWGQGPQHLPTLPPLQFTSSSAEFSCCLHSSHLSSAPSPWCLLHLRSFQGPGSKLGYQHPLSSSQVWSKQAGHGEGLGRCPKASGGVKGEGNGLFDVRREDLKASLFCWLLYEVAHPHICPLSIYDPFSLGLFSSSYFQLA